MMIYIFHAKTAKTAEFFHFIPRWRWRGRKLRYDRRTQRLDDSSTPSASLVPPVSGGQLVTIANAIIRSPSLTGRARSSVEALNVLLCLGRGEKGL